MTITQTMDIPADRWLKVKVPNEVPTGKAQVEVRVIPFPKKEAKPKNEEYEPPLKVLKGVRTPFADSLVGILAHVNKTSEELIEEMWEEKLKEYLSLK